jgi:hypothetical protein
MTFLAPAALFGLLLLALPVVVHLLRPRKMRQTPFSSLRWLKITRQRLSRRIQWHQWWLFLMRAGLVVLLVLALTKPIVGLWNTPNPTDRFIVVDAGRTMAYESADGVNPFERAKDITARLAEQGNPGDRTAILLAGATPKLITRPTADPGAHLPKLRAAALQMSDANMTSALAILPTLLGKQPSRETELIFVTANQRHAWQQGDVQSFVKQYGEKLHVQVIDVGPGVAANAWIAGASLIDRGHGEDLVLRVEIGSVGGVSQSRSVRLAGVEGLADDVREVTLPAGRAASAHFTIPASLSLAGQIAELRLEPTDALPSDDRYFLNFDMAWALRILLVEPPTDVPEQPGPGLHLRTALDALAVSGNHSFRLTNRASTTVTPGDVQAADIVILAGVPRLADEVVAGLEKRVNAGAGLIVFLGPQIEPAFYQQLFKPLQPDDGLLGRQLKPLPQTFKQGGPDTLRQVRWSHPMLAPLRDPLLGNLRLCQFLRYADFDAAPGKTDAVLARFEDDTPALIDRPLGAGRVLLWNTTADDTWTDLPRKNCFVPVVDRMLAYLSAGGVRRQFMVGEPIQLPVPDLHPGDAITVTGPDGARVPARLHTAAAQTLLHIDAVGVPGVYRVEPAGDSRKPWSFAVNTSREASALTPMDTATLESWWAPAQLEVVGGDAALARLEGQSHAWSLWPMLIVLASITLLAETIYVYRLCPHSNPAAVESVVPQRGILKPMSHPST